jgi:hypothetical protein
MAASMTVWSQSKGEKLSLKQMQQEKKRIANTLDSLKNVAIKTGNKVAEAQQEYETAAHQVVLPKNINKLKEKKGKLELSFDQQLVILDSLSGRKYYLDSLLLFHNHLKIKQQN